MEVVIPPVQSAPRIVASEELGALALFHSYATTVGMSQPAIDAALELLDVSLLTVSLACRYDHGLYVVVRFCSLFKVLQGCSSAAAFLHVQHTAVELLDGNAFTVCPQCR